MLACCAPRAPAVPGRSRPGVWAPVCLPSAGVGWGPGRVQPWGASPRARCGRNQDGRAARGGATRATRQGRLSWSVGTCPVGAAGAPVATKPGGKHLRAARTASSREKPTAALKTPSRARARHSGVTACPRCATSCPSAPMHPGGWAGTPHDPACTSRPGAGGGRLRGGTCAPARGLHRPPSPRPAASPRLLRVPAGLSPRCGG